MANKIFPVGIFYSKPRENAPEFVRGSLNFKVDEAVEFLQKHKNAQGYVNIDMLLSKEKTLYLALNEWKKPDSMLKPEEIKGIQEARNREIESRKVAEQQADKDFIEQW